MKKILNFLSLFTVSFGGIFSIVSCKNNNAHTLINGKENLNSFLEKVSFQDINNPKTTINDIKKDIKNDIDTAYENYNLVETKISKKDVDLQVQKINNFANSILPIKSYQVTISANKDSTKVWGKYQTILTLKAIPFNLQIMNNRDIFLCQNTKDLQDLLYQKAATYYLQQTQLKFTNDQIKDLIIKLKNDDKVNFVLSAGDNTIMFQKDIYIHKFQSYNIKININKDDQYFLATNRSLDQWNFKYDLTDISTSLVQKIRNAKVNLDFYKNVYTIIFNTYNKYIIDHNLGSEHLITSVANLRKTMPNLVKIYNSNDQLITDNQELLLLNKNYTVKIQAVNENRFFSLLAPAKVITNVKFYAVDISTIPNINILMNQKRDILSDHTGQDLRNFTYQQLSSAFNAYILAKKIKPKFSCTSSDLKNDINLQIIIKNKLNQIIKNQDLLNDQDSYQVFLTVSKDNFNYNEIHYFLPITNFQLTTISLNNNVDLNQISNQNLKAIINSENHYTVDELKTAIKSHFVFMHNQDTDVYNYHQISVNTLNKDPNFALDIKDLDAKNNTDSTLKFLHHYQIRLNINKNDPNFKSVSNKTWIYYHQRVKYNQDLNIINNNQAQFLNHPASKLINFAYLKLANYYNHHLKTKKDAITAGTLKNNHHFTIQIFNVDNQTILNADDLITKEFHYQINFSTTSSFYFFNITNAKIGVLNSHKMNLDLLQKTRFYHINAFTGTIFYQQIYLELSKFYNQNQDGKHEITPKILREDKHLKITPYLVTGKNTKSLITDTQSFNIPKNNSIVEIQYTAKNDPYFTSSSFIKRYHHNAINIKWLTESPTADFVIEHQKMSYHKCSTPKAAFKLIDKWIFSLYNQCQKFSYHPSLKTIRFERQQGLIQYSFSYKSLDPKDPHHIQILNENTPLNPKLKYVVLINVPSLTANIFLQITNLYQFIVSNDNSQLGI